MNRSMKILQTFIIATMLVAPSAGVVAAPREPRDFKLQADAPQFWNLVDQNAKLSVVASGFGFT
ncbi:MAG: hypothetical protein WB683_01440, partial [Candidatus Sulfotelmatobacter sp.]